MDVFGGAPRFLAYPRPVIVQSGTDAALKCQIGGDPRPAVIWERNNERIHPEARYRLFEDGNVYNLIISGVTSDDSGQYICKAKNSIGETYAAATLKVEGEAQEKELREENKPRFLIKPLSTRVGRGEDAVFSCKLWGKPLPEVVWEKDGKRLNEIFESTHFSVGYQDGGWFQLKIFKTRAPDGGVYTCKAKNEFGEGLAGAVLLVDAGPGHEEEATRNGYANGHWKAQQGKARGGRQVVSRQREEPLPHSAKVKMFAVTEGKHAKFRCYVTGKPKPEIIWRKDGRVILSGRRYLLYEDREGYFTLKVLYCKQQDNGVYVCAASNTAGQTLSAVHLTVKEPLVRFKQPLSDLEVFERELAVLECEVPEDSIPITWYLEDRRLHPGSKYGMEEWGTKRRLTIRDIGADDDGIYLCEMADGGRSIAEVAVKGTIVRKLPRKVDVLEGENAAFCVEVEEEEMEIHWYKDGVELRETHQTIIKSFGKTHILVFVNASPQDSGKVTFIVGRSKTSSQLRVKAVRHSSPSCPVGVQINTERANAALLSWLPAQDSRRNPPSGYVLERKEEGSHEWLQCLTTDSATAVEILGDSVPCEADYRFRICSVNKYGRSSHVEFPRPAHLVPGAKIQTPLQDALVPEGQDATFTIELSAAVIGTWFLNGVQLQDDERFAMRRSRTHHSLRIRAVRDTDNGVEITFIACGVRDSAALYIQAPLVKFTPLSEMDRNKFVEVGNPIVLYCELSDPATPVHWYKNGVELHTVEGLNIQSEGNMRRIVIQSAEFSHSGVYSCDAIDDVIRFNVEVEAPPVRFSALPEVAKSKSVEAGGPILLHCEISDPSAQVSWYKDGLQLLPQSGVEIQSEGTARTLAVPSADILHTGVYSCKTKGDAIKFNVDIKAQPVKFSATPEVERNKSIDAGCPIVLHCEISDPTAQVSWHKDGVELRPQSGIEIQSKATIRRLVVQSAQLCHSGVYRCETSDDAVQFTVDIKAPPVKFCSIPEDERSKSVEAGHPIVLNCQLSDPSAQVSWFKDGSELFPKPGIDIRSAGIRRTLVVEFARLSDSGAYCCSTADDTVQFNVKVKAPPVRFLNLPEEERNRCVEAGCPIILHCEISDPTGQVSWYKDEKQILSQTGIQIQSEGKTRTLTIQSAEVSHAGVYSCKTTSDVIQFNVDIRAEVFHSRLYSCEISDDTVQTIMDVKAASVEVSAEPEAKKIKYTEEASPTAPICEVINPTAKDETKPLPQIGQYIHSEGTMERDTDQSAQPPHSTKLKKTNSQSGQYIQLEGTVEKETDQSAQPLYLTHLRKNNSETGQYIQSEGTMERVIDQSAQLLHLNDLREYNSETGKYIQSEGTMERVIDQSAQPLHLSHLRENNSETGQYIQSEGTMEKVIYQSAQPLHLSHLRENNIETGQYIQSEGTMERVTDQSTQPLHLTHSKKTRTETRQYIQSEDTIERVTDQSAQSPLLTSLRKSNSETGQYIQSEGTTERVTDQSAQPLHLSHSRKNGSETGRYIQSEGTMESLTVQSTQPLHLTHSKNRTETGQYIQSEDTRESVTSQPAQPHHLTQSRKNSSDADEDATAFKVDVEAHPEDEKSNFVETDWPSVQHCELSDPTAEIKWSKDGQNLLLQNGIDIQSEGTTRGLSVQSAKLSHTGSNSCETMEDARQFHMDVKAPSTHFKESPEEERNRCVEAGCPIILHCEISDPTAQVSWHKDGVQLYLQSGVDIQSEGHLRKLVVQSAERSHSGVYSCSFADEVITFKVDVQDLPVRFSEIPEVAKSKSVEAGCPIVLQCEISESTGQVSWYKDGVQLHPKSGVEIQSEEKMRTLTIQSAELIHAGTYRCETADDTISFKVDVKAPPVTFLEMAEENLHKSIVELDPLVLNCQVSRPEATVLWYKDGAEMQPSHNVTIQAEGTMRRLILRSSQLSDAGTYTCRAGDNALIFKVNIREPPVMIIYPKEDVHLDRHVSEEVVLSCELSRSNGMVYWYKDGQKLQESQSIKLKSEGPYRRLKILNCGIEDSGEYVCDTAGDSIFFQLNITEPPVCIVSPSQSQMELCQQTSERMVLSCEISRSNATVRWYRDGLQVEESQNLLLEVDGVYRRLIIPETTVQDSAEYVCDTGDDSVTFFVNIAEPPVRFVRPRKMPSAVEVVVGNPLVLECEVSRPNAEVSWKKDGDEMEESRSVTIIEDGIFRQLTVHVSKLQHSGQYICDAKDDVMDFNVKVTEAPVKIVKKGELKTEQQHWESDDIVLECELSSADGVVQWSKDGQSVAENEHFCFEEEGAFRSLVILNAELSDTGEYACNSKDDNIVFHINVKERPVSIVGNSESRENHSLLTGDDLILACEVSRSNAPVEWYCNGTLLSPDARTHIDSYGTVRKLVLTGLRPSDSGEYICDAVDDKMIILVKVQEPPVKFLDKERANLVTGFENESVTLSATTSRDTATVRWLKDWTQISGERFHVRQEGNRHFLTIDPLHRSDGGGYTCDTTGDEMHFNLLVKEMRVRFSRPLEDAVAHKDGMVTLRCELCRTKGDVLWMKDGAEITPSRRFAIRADGPERSLTIHRLTPEDGGEYTCESKDDRTSATLRVEMPRIVEFIAELQNTTVMEGEDANFKCVVSPEDVELLWQMDNERIYPSEKFMMSSNGLCRMLHIRNCKVSDRSKITAEAEGVLSKAKLQVQEAQVLFTKKMDAVEAEEFGEATLEVEVTPEAGEVHWMRQNVVIQPGPKFTLKQNGPKRILTVHNLSLSDRGMYRCETLHDRTQGKINVEPRRISVRRGLNAIETFERETASFEVELSHGNVEGAWQKDGIRLKPSNRWRVSTKDRVHGLTLSNLTLEDTGTITFSAEGVKSSARLTVREPPVTILKKLEDHCFPEGSAVSLECELSRQNVDVKWLKNGMEMKQSKNQRIYSMGRKRFFQITKCEIRDSGVYTCDAGDVNTCSSLEVYEQEVEIVQGLEDLEIQEDQNAVFMCEVSLPDVPGEWYRNGEKIRPTGIVKIRQEGNKHFLLMCNVRVEDAGEIQFVAKQVESTASLVVEELPVSIVKPLRDKTALEGHRVVLECTVSNPRCSIRWYQGSKVILPAERFEICSEGCNRKLVIQPLEREDEGMYSVQAGEHTTSARLSVEAQLLQIVRELKDVTVAAPEEAAFECEVTVASSKAPVWSLNEETLRPGPQVRMESRDTVHRLILKNTSADMSGTVRFSSGKAKSSARLTVTD